MDRSRQKITIRPFRGAVARNHGAGRVPESGEDAVGSGWHRRGLQLRRSHVPVECGSGVLQGMGLASQELEDGV